MASEVVSAQTRLRSADGWLSPSDCTMGVQILGINRHGKVSESRVVVAPEGASTPQSYMGSTLAFGGFAGKTRILQADGGISTVENIIESGDVVDRLYENVFPQLPEKMDMAHAEAALRRLTFDASFISEFSCAIRCCSQGQSVMYRPPSMRIRRISGVRFCEVEFVSGSRDFGKSPASFIESFSRTIYTDSEASRLAIGRTHVDMIVWMLSATRGPCVLSYDNLQHTCFVYISDSVDSSPISRGRVAFRSARSCETFMVEWTDRSWHPIASGFLLAGGWG